MSVQEEFERWVDCKWLLQKRDHPKRWGGDDTEYLSNPYEHPWTEGAYEAWKYLRGIYEQK